MIHLYTFDYKQKDIFSQQFKYIVKKEMDSKYKFGDENCNTEFLHAFRIDNAGASSSSEGVRFKHTFNYLDGITTKTRTITFPSTYFYNSLSSQWERKSDDYNNVSDKLYVCVFGIEYNHDFKYVNELKKDINKIKIKYGFLYEDFSSAISTKYQAHYNQRFNLVDGYNPHPITHLVDLDNEFELEDKDEYTGSGTTFNLLNILGASNTTEGINSDFFGTKQTFMDKIQENIDRQLLINNVFDRNLLDLIKINVDSSNQGR